MIFYVHIEPFFKSYFQRCLNIFSIITLLFFSSQFGVAQSSFSENDSIKAAQFTSTGNSFIKLKQYDSALIKFNEAAEIYKNSNAWNSFFYSQFQMAYYLNVQGKYDENIAYLDSIESNFGQYLSAKDKSFQRFYGVKSWAHFKLIQMAKALYYFNLLEEAAGKNDAVSANDLHYAVFYKGIVYQRIGQYNLALIQMNLSRDLCESEGVCDFLGNTYNNLGIIYRNLGEYERSAEFYRKALSILKQNSSEVNLTPIYNNLAKVYLFQEKYEEALNVLNNAIKVLNDYTPDYYQVESALINTKANLLIKMKKFEEAENILKKVYDREVEKYGETGANSSETLYSLGKLYSAKSEFGQSNEYLKLSIKVTESFLGDKNDKSAEMYNLIGKNKLSIQHYFEAAETFQASIISLVPEFNDVDIYNNPALEEAILDRVELVDALYQKGEALRELYLTTDKKQHLEGALGANKTVVKLVEQVRNTMLYQSSIVRLSEKVKAVYEQSITLELLNNKGKRSSLNSIYDAIENSKSYTLATSVQRAKSLGYSSQEDSVLLEEEGFKTTIKILESEVRSAVLTNKDSSEIMNLEEGLFTAKEKFEAYEAKVAKQLNHSKRMKVPLLEKVQLALNKGDLLIDYFAGESALFAIAISSTRVEVYDLKEYRETVYAFRESISQNIKAQNFERIAYETYGVILSPIIADFSNTSRLIIMPDQQLGSISFDALVTELQKEGSFKKLNYLVNDFTIYQHQSASLFVEKTFDSENTKGGYIGFAPDFGSKELSKLENRNLRGDLQPLPFAKAEVEQIAGLLNGVTETGSEANETNFKSMATDYAILHIASHAIIDNERPLYSKLVFASGDSTQQEDGDLYSFEIYGLKLKSDLVTLSACNTGNGKFYEGEGIFSLGRAFLVAGANSVLTSLWEVSDQSTSQIMTSFYKRLKEGTNKPEALRQAKLAYLKNADGLTANPYYWAGFVYTGKPESVYKSYKLYYWLGGILLLFIIGSIFLRRRKQMTTY